MSDLTPEERAERENDPSELTRRVYAHPWRMGAGAGLLIAGWVFWLSDGSALLALGTGVGMMLLYGLAWRPGGFGQRIRRYMLKTYPKEDGA